MDQEPKQELSGKTQRQLLGEQIREEISAFEEERPFSKGEYFGNLEQNFPGGNYRRFVVIDNENEAFISDVDKALAETEVQRQEIIIATLGKKDIQRPLIELLADLRLELEIKSAESRKLENEKELDAVGEELAKLNNSINDLLLLPYIELRLAGHDHERITR